MCTHNANERKNIVRKDMKMNKLRLTNKIENHFYLDFNWKDETVECSVSWQEKARKRPKRLTNKKGAVSNDSFHLRGA